MTKKEYIEKAVSGIKGKTERREVEEELSMHIDELTELWRGRGYDEAAAEEEAVKDMGYPETTAEELRAVHTGTFGDFVEVLVWIGIVLLCVGLFPLAYSFILVASDLFSMPLLPFCLAFEAVFLCFCTLLILYGVRRKTKESVRMHGGGDPVRCCFPDCRFLFYYGSIIGERFPRVSAGLARVVFRRAGAVGTLG